MQRESREVHGQRIKIKWRIPGFDLLSVLCQSTSFRPQVSHLVFFRINAPTYFAARHALTISRRASSDALASSWASCNFCFISSCVLGACLFVFTGRAVVGKLIPLSSSPRAPTLSTTGVSEFRAVLTASQRGGPIGNPAADVEGTLLSLVGDRTFETSSSESSILREGPAGVPTGVEGCRRPIDPLGCRRVTPPRVLRISSTS